MDGSQPFGAQYPQIRGTGYVEPQPVSVGGASAGPPQNRIFRNASPAPTVPNVPYVPPSYPAGHYDHHEHGYSFQTINGQYVNTGKRKKRSIEEEDYDPLTCRVGVKPNHRYKVDVTIDTNKLN